MQKISVFIISFSMLWLMSCAESGVSNNMVEDAAPTDKQEQDAGQVDVTEDINAPLDTFVPVDTSLPEDVGQDTAGPGDFGTPCDDADDCNSGYCVQSADGTVCSKTCEDNCPDSWSCKQLLSGGDAIYICLPNFPTLCMPCSENTDCQLPGSESYSRCLPMGEEGSFCGGDCANVPCPDGYSCQNTADVLGQETNQCVKDDGLCECSNLAVAKTAKTECSSVNEFGACSAERQCLEDGLSLCEALTPSPEVCDGVDNNCDEVIDEDVSCDDANPCTEDACEATQGCANTPLVGTPCDDGNLETAGDACGEDGTCAGEPYTCPDVSTCTPTYFQDGEACQAEHAEVGTPCDDGEATTLDDVCNGEGACSGSPFECPDISTCIPGYVPNGVDCVPTVADLGTLCSDGINTTQGDACDGAGNCVGTAYECPESTLCILAYVQDGAGCLAEYAPKDTGCDDGSDVTHGDVCDGEGLCAGTPFGCPAPTICTPSYNQDGDACTAVHAESGTPCNDGSDETQEDLCDGDGVCVGTPYECPKVTACTPSYTQDGSGCFPTYADSGSACDDGSVATKDDGCNGQGGCFGEPYSCPIPSTCTPSYTQDGSDCVPNHEGIEVVCDDGDLATKSDVCDGAGGCAGTPFGCPDATPCTPSYSQVNGQCVPNHADSGVACSDGLMTTKNDACSGFGVCSGTEYECPAPTQCTPGFTKDGVGCVPNHADEGTVCDDGNQGSKDDACDGDGGCEGSPYSCPEPTACTPSYTQDGIDCVANHAGFDIGCNDGDATTKNDACDGKGGCAGTPFGCPEATTCTPSYSQVNGQCVPNYADSGVGCDDGLSNTKNDACSGFGVCSGTEYECPVATDCTPSYVKDGEVCVPDHADEGTACDDGNLASKDDGCDGSGGCEGSPYSCPEPTACTPSYTQDGTDCIANHAGIEVSCDDGDATTKDDVCDGSGGCAGTPFGCPGATTCTPSYSQKDGQCVPNHADSGIGCDDGLSNTKNDVCSGFGVCSGTEYECPAATDCTPSYIKDGVGCAPQYADDGSGCDDKTVTTKNDVCDGAGECAGTPYSCDIPTTCTPSYTQDGNACIANHADIGVGCDDGDPSTKGDVCNGTGACSGTPFGCPEPTVCTPSYTQDGDQCVANHAKGGVACDDGLADTKNDECSGFGVCSGTAYECPAPTSCTPSYTKDGAECVPNHANLGTGCNDGDVTTQDDACDGAGGCVGSPYACPQTTSCTPSYSQDGVGCVAQYADPGAGCNDADATTKNDVCDGKGECAGTPFECPAPTTCTPSYTQDGSGCSPNHADPGADCDDGDPSTNDDVCNGSGICSGSPYSCPLTDSCTPSYKQDGIGCTPDYADQGAGCNDGDAGTKNDICDGAGSCSGSPYECPAPTSCTPGYTQDGSGCNPNHAAPGAGCDDKNNATKNDVCNGSGSCAGSPYSCPAGSTCTPSYLQDGSGCVAQYAGPGVGCDDKNNATKNDVCDGGGACAGSPYNCPAPTTCTPNYTQDGNACIANHALSGTACNDKKVGTKNDMCDGLGTCEGSSYECPAPTQCTLSYSQDGSGCNPHYADPGVGCDDKNVTTKEDVCNGSGTCSGSAYNCPAPTTCTPSYTQNGSECIANHAGPGALCNDGKSNTNNDVCNGSGTCSGTPYSCPGTDACTPSYTQDGSGCVAHYANNGTGCNDGNNGTNNDVCNGAGTCKGTPYGCPGGTTCTPSYTQNGSGCVANHANNGTGCNDGNNGTNNDVCNGVGSCSGTPYGCPGGTTCTPSYTQDGSGCVANHANNGTGCNDNNNGTNNDVCSGVGTCKGTPYGCPGGTTCTPSYTQNGSGCVANHANNGTGCNDGNNGTNNDVCNGVGTCKGTAYGCPGGTTCTPSYTQNGSGCVANHANNGTGCNDGNNGTNNDVCNGAGTCKGTPYGCPGGTTCTPSYTQNGSECVANHAKSGTGCNDGNNGTNNDVCNGAGTCKGTPYGCPGGTTCTPSYSQNGSGCVANHANYGTGCNDGNNGTKNDICNGAGSCSGTGYSCPGGTTCTPSYSQNGSGCVANYANNGTGCNDGNNGTNNDVCNGSGSCSGTGYSCPGTTTCTPSYSQDGSGCNANHANNGTGCNDGNNSTKNDVCNGSGSCSGISYNCPGGTICTPSYSQDGVGCNANHANNGTGCNDNNNSTKSDICNGAGSCAGTPYGCPAATTCTPSYSQDGVGCNPSHAGVGVACDDGNGATSNDICDGSGGCAGQAAVCGNGKLEPGEKCDGGKCCNPNCTFQPNGSFCGIPGFDFGGCQEYQCSNGACSNIVDTCPWGQHCCEFGCVKQNQFCP
jgi:hypothetical protein